MYESELLHILVIYLRFYSQFYPLGCGVLKETFGFNF